LQREAPTTDHDPFEPITFRLALGAPRKSLLTEKDVAARGWPEFAIGEFLGEPASERGGRRYHEAGKILAAEALPPVIDAIRRHRAVTQATLRKRGWSRNDIKTLLGEPDLILPNPNYHVAAPMKLYRVGRIEDAEVAHDLERPAAPAAKASTAKPARFYPCERVVHAGSSTVTLKGSIALDPALAATDKPLAVAQAAATADGIAADLERRLTEAMTRDLGSGPTDDVKGGVFVAHSLAHAADRAFFELEHSYKALATSRRKAEAEAVMAFYLESFPKEGRRFEYFCGPTNSGKTYAAIEELRGAESGVYLAPLRLLALEVYERLNELGVPTSLLTGEERSDTPGATHVSSTVEMADLRTSVDVAVIDEAQMLEDSQRGWAWTLAALGIRASRIILCGSIEGLRAARLLAQRMGLEITVRRFTRKNPLAVDAPIELRSVRPGDAVIVFSRRDVIDTQRLVGELGFSTAVIYGSLSPSVRREEAARFRNGEAEVLVATDAIAMGLNLPIRRVVFSTTQKWNGKEERVVSAMELRQIAGRAGRYGIHEKGHVTGLTITDVHRVTEAVVHDRRPQPTEIIWVAPTTKHLERLAEINGEPKISRLLKFFQANILRADKYVKLADLSEMIETVEYLEHYAPAFSRLPLEIRYAYARSPVNRNGVGLAYLARWAESHARLQPVSGEEIAGVYDRERLMALEEMSRIATLYMWLSQRFSRTYNNARGIESLRAEVDEEIRKQLLNRGRASNRRKGRRKRKETIVSSATTAELHVVEGAADQPASRSSRV
jgi:ATP-dependent RNA helicase SUPV3L1/SUV3